MGRDWKGWTAAAVVLGLGAGGLSARGDAGEEGAAKQAAAPAGQFPIVQEEDLEK